MRNLWIDYEANSKEQGNKFCKANAEMLCQIPTDSFSTHIFHMKWWHVFSFGDMPPTSPWQRMSCCPCLLGEKIIRLQVWSFRICGTSPPPSHTLQNKQCYHLDMIPLLHSVCLVLGLQSNVVDASIASLSHQTFTKLVCYATIVTGIFISCMMETHLNWAYKRKNTIG